MSEKETNFADLSESVILDLKALGYMDSTLTNYRRFYARLEMFMKTVSAKEYSSERGVPYDTVRKILGHSDADAIKHYVKTDIERLRCCAIDPPEPAGIFFELLDGRRQV